MAYVFARSWVARLSDARYRYIRGTRAKTPADIWEGVPGDTSADEVSIWDSWVFDGHRGGSHADPPARSPKGSPVGHAPVLLGVARHGGEVDHSAILERVDVYLSSRLTGRREVE